MSTFQQSRRRKKVRGFLSAGRQTLPMLTTHNEFTLLGVLSSEAGGLHRRPAERLSIITGILYSWQSKLLKLSPSGSHSCRLPQTLQRACTHFGACTQTSPGGLTPPEIGRPHRRPGERLIYRTKPFLGGQNLWSSMQSQLSSARPKQVCRLLHPDSSWCCKTVSPKSANIRIHVFIFFTNILLRSQWIQTRDVKADFKKRLKSSLMPTSSIVNSRDDRYPLLSGSFWHVSDLCVTFH